MQTTKQVLEHLLESNKYVLDFVTSATERHLDHETVIRERGVIFKKLITLCDRHDQLDFINSAIAKAVTTNDFRDLHIDIDKKISNQN